MLKTPIETDHKGKTYDSQAEMCRAYHVSQSLFLKRISRGWSLQEALEGKVYYEYNGISYKTQEDFCSAFGISSVALRKKLKMGFTMEQICNGEAFLNIEAPSGKRYKNERQMCKDLGIPYGTYRARLDQVNSKEYALLDGYMTNSKKAKFLKKVEEEIEIETKHGTNNIQHLLAYVEKLEKYRHVDEE